MTTIHTSPMTFGRWLKQLRTQRDLTQEALAGLAFCSVQAIRAFEGGKRRPSLEMAERLAAVLQVAAEQRAAFVRLARTALIAETAESAPISSATVPSTAAPTVTRFSLPSATTPFIGREAEINTLSHLLCDEEQRLVTIVGPGGVGKSRLALDLTATLAGQFADGAGFVSLAAISQVQHLSSAIASSLNIPLQGATDLQPQVNTWLAARQMLLTLDNFEQLLGQAEIGAWVRELLVTAPQLHLLVTSRERLRVSGERIFELAGLPLPAPNHPLEQTDAVLLFLERAQQVAPDFVIHVQNHAAISRICHLVEGMPLGIELAAAWVHVLTLDEIADEISRSIDFLARADRDMTPRHRSMRAVFDHSWQLLNEEERQVLMKLAVFRGGCTREAAQQVAAATLPVLASLIDKSLLRKSQSTPTRYTMHELVRQSAYEKLTAAGAGDAVQQIHLQQMIGFAMAHAEQLGKATHKDAVAQLTNEHDNLRSALQWALEHAHSDAGLELAQAASLYWRLTGQSREGLQWFVHLFAQPSLVQNRALLARAYYQAMVLAWNMSDRDRVAAYYAEGLRLSQQQGDRLTEADLYEAMASVAVTEAEMRALSEQALAIYRELGASGSRGAAFSTEHLASLASAAGDHQRASQLYAECLTYFDGHGDLMHSADVMRKLAKSYFRQQEYGAATRLYNAALHIYQTIDDQQGVYLTQTHLGDIPLVNGNVSDAEAYYRSGLAGAWQFEDTYVLAWGFDNLARTALAQGHWERAVQLFAAADAHFQRVGGWLRRHDHAGREELIAQARRQVGEDRFARAWALGAILSTQQAYQVALGEEPRQ